MALDRGSICDEHREKIEAVGDALDQALNSDDEAPPRGFALFVFDLGVQVTSVSYVSNARRRDLHEALQHWLDAEVRRYIREPGDW